MLGMLAMTDMGPVEIWQSMGTVGRLVLVFLLLMSTYSIVVMIDRYLMLRKARRQTLRFVERADAPMEKHDYGAVRSAADEFPGSHVARIYRAAIADYQGYDGPPPDGFDALMGRACEREAVLVGQQMKRGLGALASIGATAPFVGLFGTVVGIMNAFFGMASSGEAGIGAVAGGIAEALVNTAVGLFVALPAVWAYNFFLVRIERRTVEMQNVTSDLVDHFIRRSWSQEWMRGQQERRLAR